ncbi:MAG: hypothetical protein AMJ53_08630 [Gammaproteobacteria bacterium SG8_11]|nr:MAG: hypothetical protein AMJ53_08630 [Gammaproteobacteria bacterium SG8_11]
MFKALAEKIFQRQPHEDELVKLRQIAERAERFEQAVIESMRSSFDDTQHEENQDLDSKYN